MQRKIFLVLLVLLIAFPLTVPFAPAQQTEANGFVRIVAGSTASKLAKGIGEKAGLKFATKKQEERMVGYINKKAETDPVYTQFVNDLNNAAKQTKETDRPGWKKYLLDPAMWITGADILLDGYNAFMFAYQNGTTVDTISAVTGGTSSGFLDCAVRAGALRVYFRPNTQYNTNIYNGTNVNYCKITYQSKLPSNATSGYITYNYEFEFGNGYKSSDNSYNERLYVVFPFSWDGASGFEIPEQITPSLYDIPQQYEVVDLNDYDFDETDPEIPVYIPETENPDQEYTDVPWNDVQEPPPPKDPPAVEPPDEEKPSGWKWWDWLLKPLIKLIEGIGDLLSGIGDAIKSIVDFILGLAEWLLGLIVPSGEFFSNFFDDIHAAFEGKIPIIPQLMDFFTSIENVSTSGQPPKFTFTLPEDYGGTTHSLIDFSSFDDFRVYILNFIRFIAWFIFLKKLFNRIPKIIY